MSTAYPCSGSIITLMRIAGPSFSLRALMASAWGLCATASLLLAQERLQGSLEAAKNIDARSVRITCDSAKGAVVLEERGIDMLDAARSSPAQP